MGIFTRRASFEISPDPVEVLIEQEQLLPEHIYTDNPLRIKVTENCGLTCKFCHNEGTVAPNDARQSIYVTGITTETGKLVADSILPDDDLHMVLAWMRDVCEVDEVHWTGGEPTLNRWLPQTVQMATDLSLVNKMTSNGQRGAEMLSDLSAAGLKSVNYSIYGLDPAQFQATQYRSSQRQAEHRIAALNEAIDESLQLGMSVKANIVVTPQDAYQRVTGALETIDPRVGLRFQTDLRDQEAGSRAVRTIMVALGGRAVRRQMSAGSSNQMISYAVSDYEDRVIGLKSFRRSRMPKTCDGCPIDAAGNCEEGYYGPRLFREKGVEGIGKYVIGVCLQRMELSERFDAFVDGYKKADKKPRVYSALTGGTVPLSLAHAVKYQSTSDESDVIFKRGPVPKYYHTKEGIIYIPERSFGRPPV